MIKPYYYRFYKDGKRVDAAIIEQERSKVVALARATNNERAAIELTLMSLPEFANRLPNLQARRIHTRK